MLRRILLHAIFCLLPGTIAFGQQPAEETGVPAPAENPAASKTQGPDASPHIVDAANEAELRRHLKQTILVKGVVDRLEITASSKNGRLFFKGAEKSACLYFKKKVQEEHPEWKPGELKGKEIYAVGKLTLYNNLLTITITSPQHIADSPDSLKAAVAAGGESKGDTPPPPPETGPPVKRQEATVLQALLTWTKGEPKLEVTQQQAVWKKKATSKSPVLVVGKHSKLPDAAGLALELIKAKYKELPGGKTLTIQSPGTSLPSAAATALLVESTLQDVAIPSSLVVLGELSPNGAFDKATDTLLYLNETSLAAGSIILAPLAVEPLLVDLAVDGAWKSLCAWQILGAERLDGAVKSARQLTEPVFRRQLDNFAEVQARVAKEGISALKQPAIKNALLAFVQSCPEHLTAKLFLTASTSRLPEQYSPDGARLRLRQFITRVLEETKSLPSDRGDRRKKLRELTDAYKLVRQKCPPTMKPNPASVDEFIKAAEEKFRLDDTDKSDRAKSQMKKAESAYDKAYETMRQEIDVGERKK